MQIIGGSSVNRAPGMFVLLGSQATEDHSKQSLLKTAKLIARRRTDATEPNGAHRLREFALISARVGQNILVGTLRFVPFRQTK